LPFSFSYFWPVPHTSGSPHIEDACLIPWWVPWWFFYNTIQPSSSSKAWCRPLLDYFQTPRMRISLIRPLLLVGLIVLTALIVWLVIYIFDVCISFLTFYSFDTVPLIIV
jgi:hypothetical protein